MVTAERVELGDDAAYPRAVKHQRARWPGNASLVVNVVINYASVAEYWLLDWDDRNDSQGEYSYQVARASGTWLRRRALPELSTPGGGPE